MNVLLVLISIIMITFSCSCESSKKRPTMLISPTGKIAVIMNDKYNSSIDGYSTEIIEYPMEIIEFDDIKYNEYRKICDLPVSGNFRVVFCDSTSIAFFITGIDNNQHLLNFYYNPVGRAETLLTISYGDSLYEWLLFSYGGMIPKDSIIAGDDSTGVRLCKILPGNKVETRRFFENVLFPNLSQDNKQLLMSKSAFINEVSADGDPIGGYILIYDIALDSVILTISTPTSPFYYQRKTEDSPIYYIRPHSINGPNNLYKYNFLDSEDIKLTDFNLPSQVGDFYLMEDSIVLLMDRVSLEEDLRFEVYHEK